MSSSCFGPRALDRVYSTVKRVFSSFQSFPNLNRTIEFSRSSRPNDIFSGAYSVVISDRQIHFIDLCKCRDPMIVNKSILL
jgi:hypothetical protein